MATTPFAAVLPALGVLTAVSPALADRTGGRGRISRLCVASAPPASPCPASLIRGRSRWPVLGNLREEPSAEKPLAWIHRGRMAEAGTGRSGALTERISRAVGAHCSAAPTSIRSTLPSTAHGSEDGNRLDRSRRETRSQARPPRCVRRRQRRSCISMSWARSISSEAGCEAGCRRPAFRESV